MKILMTGATGLIGKELGKNLFLKGHELLILSRNAERAQAALPFPCRVIEGDLASGKLSMALPPVDVVINLMGESVGDGRWTQARKRKMFNSRVLGTRHLIASLSAAPKVFINASAVGYYGSCGDQLLTEDHEGGEDFLAQLCQDWEEELLPLAYGDTAMTRVVALRTGMVLAVHGGALDPIRALFRKGVGGVLGDGTQWMSWVHIQDAVGLIVHALEVPAVRGPMNLVSPHPVTNREFTAKFAAALRVRPGPAAPRVALQVALGEMASLVLTSQRAVPEVALKTGYQFHFADLAEALADVSEIYAGGEDVFFSEQYLPFKPERVFPFFSDARNLQKITPPLLHFEIKGEPPSVVSAGARIHYNIRVHGFPMEWITEIQDWKPPFSFVDTQEKGPYKFWHHTHEFLEFGEGTLMRDQVRYRLPLGFLGNLVAAGFVRGDVEKIFDFRREYLFRHLGRDIS